MNARRRSRRAQGYELTRRQFTVLVTLEVGVSYTARRIGVRSDVLWRLEERGMVGRNADMDPKWSIRPAGHNALAHARGEPA